MTPERAFLFLADLHTTGWVIILGQSSAVATHPDLGVAHGAGNDFAEMVDALRAELQRRGLAE